MFAVAMVMRAHIFLCPLSPYLPVPLWAFPFVLFLGSILNFCSPGSYIPLYFLLKAYYGKWKVGGVFDALLSIIYMPFLKGSERGGSQKTLYSQVQSFSFASSPDIVLGFVLFCFFERNLFAEKN